MKTKIHLLILSIASLLVMPFIATSCNDDDKSTPPTVEIAKSSVTSTTITFSVSSENAKSCAYYFTENTADANKITDKEIFSKGTLVENVKLQSVTLKDLTPETEYFITAAAKSEKGEIVVVKTPIVATTDKAAEVAELKIMLTAGAVTDNSISFTVIPTNAESCAYHYFEKPEEGEIPTFTSAEIFEKGVTLEKAETQLVTISDLESGTEYIVTAAVKTSTESLVVETPLAIATTGIDPGLIMKVEISDVTKTHNSITFTVTVANAGHAAWDVERVTEDYSYRSPDFVASFGKKIDNLYSPTTWTASDLVDDTTYVIYAVVESGDGLYKREMKTLEVKTLVMPDPEDLPLVTLDNAIMKSAFRGRNYLIELENSNYNIKLDMYGAEDADNAYRPILETGTYIHSKANSGQKAWTLDFLSYVEHKVDGKLKLEKGEIAVAYTAPNYAITGYFITEDNKKFNFEYKGELPYPVYGMETGEIEETATGYDMTLEGSIHNLKLVFANKDGITGDHVIGTTIDKTSAIITQKGVSYTLESGTLKITEPTTDRINVTGTLILQNGDKIAVNIENANVSIPEPPVSDEVTFTTASSQSWEEDEGWGMTGYYVKLTDSTGNTKLEFEMGDLSGTMGKLSTGKYIWSSASDELSHGGIGWLKLIKNSVNVTTSLDRGEVVITKEDNTYTVKVKFTFNNKDEFLGTYTGPITCTTI